VSRAHGNTKAGSRSVKILLIQSAWYSSPRRKSLHVILLIVSLECLASTKGDLQCSNAISSKSIQNGLSSIQRIPESTRDPNVCAGADASQHRRGMPYISREMECSWYSRGGDAGAYVAAKQAHHRTTTQRTSHKAPLTTAALLFDEREARKNRCEKLEACIGATNGPNRLRPGSRWE